MVKFSGIIAVALAFIFTVIVGNQAEASKTETKAVKATKELQVKASNEWTKETYRKRDRLVEIGMPKEIATSLIIYCKATSKNPVHCIKIGSSILGAESSVGKNCHNNNCVGMNDGAVGYKSKDAGIKAWVEKYNKFWYKQPNPSGFYRADGIPPATRYCMGKNRDGVCKEGTKNSWAVWNKLSDI